MNNQPDQRDNIDPANLRDDRSYDFQQRSASLQPLPPAKFRVEKAQNGVRCFAADRGKVAPAGGRISGSIAYVVRWVEQIGSGEQLSSYRVRSIALAPQIPASGRDGVEAVAFFQDPKYSSGWLFCVGVDQTGKESDDASAPLQITDQILDDSVPSDPTHVQITGSGEYVGSDVVEAVTVSCIAPQPLGSFDGVQLFLKDYVNLGSIQEGEFHRYTSVAGGSMQFKVNYSICKRVGANTITLTKGSTAVTGSGFLTLAQAGDLVCSGLITGTIQSVNSDTSITLTSNWTGKSVTGATDYYFIGKVTVYLVSVSKGGTHRADVTNAPSASFLFDGSLGTPNAVSVGTATTAGNVIRLEFQQVLGTKIKGYKLYRGTGSGIAFASCTVLDFIPQPKETTSSASSFLQFEDSSFTTYQREQGQIFTYRITTVNEAAVNNESADFRILTAGAVDPSCSLDAARDDGPQVPAREIALNLLWDGMFSGTAAGTVGGAVLTDQDANMGGAPPTGFQRWTGASSGVGQAPGFQNTTEVILAMNNVVGTGQSQVLQVVGAYDNATAAARHVPKGKALVLQVKARTSGGAPNGTLTLAIAQLNAGVLQGYAHLRVRLSNDTVDETTNTALSIAGSNFTTAHQIYWGIFIPDTTLTTTDFRVEITYGTTNWNSVNVNITEAMLSVGETLPPWTGQLVDKAITYQPPTGGAPTPGRFVDGDASRRDWIRTP